MSNGLEDVSFRRDGNCGSVEAYGTSVRDCTFRGKRGVGHVGKPQFDLWQISLSSRTVRQILSQNKRGERRRNVSFVKL